MTISEQYGYPYYNQKKPLSYLVDQANFKIASIDKQIEELTKKRKEAEQYLMELKNRK